MVGFGGDIIQYCKNKKHEILEAASELFQMKGYDNTTVMDIIEEVGIAKGTLYHYFDSKEEILDTLILNQTEEALQRSRLAAENPSIPIKQKIFLVISSLQVEKTPQNEELFKEIHKPQNILMHSKIYKRLYKYFPSILAGVIEEGIEKGIFKTPYPLETTEMLVVYLSILMDMDYLELEEEEQYSRLKSAIFNMERLLNTKPGFFSSLLQGMDQGDDYV